MPWQGPYTSLELHQFNPHGFAYGDRVVLPDDRLGTVSKVGYKYGHVDADAGADWKGLNKIHRDTRARGCLTA